MSSSGPNSGGTFANDTTVGSSNWASLSAAAASDDVRADSGALGTTATYYLKATNFGFSISGTIDGITVAIERQGVSFSGQKFRDFSLKLVKSGSVTGSDYAATSTDWPNGTDATATYGGATDLWGTTWTDTEINDSGFGVAISGKAFNFGKGGVTGFIDHISITVNYTAGGAAGQPTSKRFGGVPFMGAHGAGIPSAVRQWMRRDSGLFAPQLATAIWRPAHGIN